MKPWWWRLGGYARANASGLPWVPALMLVTVGADLLKPWPLKLIVDNVLTGAELPSATAWLAALPGAGTAAGLLAWLAGATLLLFVVGRGAKMTQSFVHTGVGNRMIYGLGAELFAHLQRMSLRFHDRHAIGDLLRRVAHDTTCVRDLVLHVGLPVLTSVATLIAMVTVMIGLDPTLSLFALAVAFPLIVLVRLFNRAMSERSHAEMVARGRITSLAERTLTSVPVVQAFCRERQGDRWFRDASRETVRTHVRALDSQLQLKTVSSVVLGLGTASIVAVGGLHVLDGRLSVGSLLVFLSYLTSLYAPIQTLVHVSTGFAAASAGARRVLEVLDSREGVEERPDARALTPTGAGGLRVRLDRVSFGYEPGRPVLDEVSLELRPGETVALVGPTGAGKSTLVSLIPRFFDPWSGSVRVDGQDLRELTLSSLRSRIGMVLQEPFILPLTVAENIAYGHEGAGRDAIEAAARAARAERFIKRLPAGYDTTIGERGTTLSGGERQRLAIARGLLKDAPLLILDEPASALDAATESELMQALERLMQGRTTLLISHRLTLARRADRILVLDAGRVVENGSHDELMGRQGLYRKMFLAAHPVSRTGTGG